MKKISQLWAVGLQKADGAKFQTRIGFNAQKVYKKATELSKKYFRVGVFCFTSPTNYTVEKLWENGEEVEILDKVSDDKFTVEVM